MSLLSGRLEPELADLIYPPPRRVAVLGLSDRAGRPSHDVAALLLRWGYEIIPVRPGQGTILGQPCHATLSCVPGPVDIVDVFRRSEHVRGHLDDILSVRPRLLWLQDGVRDDAVAEAARRAGIAVVQDDCLARRIGELRVAHGD
jgi:uncharacterized protein